MNMSMGVTSGMAMDKGMTMDPGMNMDMHMDHGMDMGDMGGMSMQVGTMLVQLGYLSLRCGGFPPGPWEGPSNILCYKTILTSRCGFTSLPKPPSYSKDGTP